MHPLLRFTLDLFETNRAPAPENQAPLAIKIIAPELASFRHPRANREARLCELVVAYEFKRAQRRSIGFLIAQDGLVVRAPKWVPLHQVDAALQDKSNWIIKKLTEGRARQQQLLSRRIAWCDGALIPYLGQSLRLRLVSGPASGASAELQAAPTASDGAWSLQGPALTLSVALPDSATPDQIRDAVQVWLKRQAHQLFSQRLDHFAPQLQVQWRKLTLSNASTRWGSARIDGSIRLNWRLMHFAPAVIDYVVAHELSHLRVMDHGPRFWATVRSVMPDYARLRRQLKDEALAHPA